MGKNEEVRFGTIPPPEVPRSIFDLSHGHMTTCNIGELIPIEWTMCLPGDTFRWKTSSVVRLQTMLTPTFSTIYGEIRHFAVPLRLIWDHVREFFGENTTSPWIQNTSYTIPAISAPSGGFAVGTLADKMGLPVGVDWNATDKGAPMALPFRAYAKVVNDWWNSEVLNYPLNIPTGDSNQTGTNGGSFINDIANGGKPFVAAKFFDLFSSSLPSPQKGPSVTFPLIQGSKAPVYPTTTNTFAVGATLPSDSTSMLFGTRGTTLGALTGQHNLELTNGAMRYVTSSSSNTDADVFPANLWADLSSSVGSVTVNELRLAFQLQKFYEKCARGGFESGLRVNKIEEKNWKAA